MISMVFGLPGSGKSVFLGKCAADALADKPTRIGMTAIQRAGYDHVVTNFAFSGADVFHAEQLGTTKTENCLFLIDECGIFFGNRDYKNFPRNLMLFFSQHRKMDCDIIVCSQGARDADLKIRQLCQKFYYIRKLTSRLSAIAPIEQFVDVEGAEIRDGYRLAPPIQHRLLYLPRYWSLIDTHEIITKSDLEPPKYQKWDTICNKITQKTGK